MNKNSKKVLSAEGNTSNRVSGKLSFAKDLAPALLILALACLILTGCGTVTGVKMRCEKQIDSLYCPTKVEARFANLLMEADFFQSGGWLIGAPLYLDLPLTAISDTVLMPWDLYILQHPYVPVTVEK